MSAAGKRRRGSRGRQGSGRKQFRNKPLAAVTDTAEPRADLGHWHRGAGEGHLHAAFAHHLIAQTRKLYLGVELENTAYALDSTTIDLCLTMGVSDNLCAEEPDVQ